MRKIKVAQIGLSQFSHGRQIFSSMKKQNDLFELVGYALPDDPNSPCLEGIPELTLEQILNNPEIEAVTVETLEVLQTKYALMAAEANKHVHMEKPGGCDHELYKKLIETMRKNGKVFHTGYMYRYNPYVMELMERIQKGDLGEIFSIDAQMNCRHSVENRQWMETLPGGMMWFLGCHMVDLIYRIQGEPQKITALNRPTFIDGVTGQDFAMAVMEYPNGVSFAKACDEEIGGYARRQLVVHGSKGTVEIRPLEMGPEKAMYVGKTEYFADSWQDKGVYSQSELFDRYDTMMASFAAMVRGDKVNPYTLDYELGLHKVLCQCAGMEV